ncbi:hypothetical protein B0T26DRAFT_710925 [Lasiosphaeria miniovina]|uniref:Uncharacterized protein n=1 Tax=Lasiosphaeria miniovina TaxID=1954250 RepID=A0AA40AL11_9PEZI|nr:uncharacterized protein B0T26DRAFT_710925 [Lasiosphaeria miniovina]KAK0717821.1 hypothetical protein B0T26DRAFT_710925 [Lasiosphaeria miniovina]
MAAAPTRGDLDKLRDLYVAALVHSGRTVGSARAAEHEVAQLAADELRITRGARRPARALRHFLLAASYKDQLTAAVGLLVWSAYMFGTAALNWPLLHNGSKGGGQCDDVPTVYFVLAPKKPFADAGFATFLKVWTVGVVLVAVVTTAVALFILAVALVGPRGVGLITRRRGVRGDKSLEAGGGGGGAQENIHSSAGYRSHQARGRHAQEVLACLHQAEGRSAHHRYRGSSSRTTATPPLRFSVWNIPWALLLAVLLAVTVATAELTTHRQGPFNNVPLDFARPPLHETAEILAFLVGLYALVLTLLSVLGAAVAAFQSRRRSRHVASHRKHARV